MLQLSIIFMAMTFVVFTGYGVFAAGARGRIRLLGWRLQPIAWGRQAT